MSSTEPVCRKYLALLEELDDLKHVRTLLMEDEAIKYINKQIKKTSIRCAIAYFDHRISEETIRCPILVQYLRGHIIDLQRILNEVNWKNE